VAEPAETETAPPRIHTSGGYPATPTDYERRERQEARLHSLRQRGFEEWIGTRAPLVIVAKLHHAQCPGRTLRIVSPGRMFGTAVVIVAGFDRRAVRQLQLESKAHPSS
jgi:hypothetical protein